MRDERINNEDTLEIVSYLTVTKMQLEIAIVCILLIKKKIKAKDYQGSLSGMKRLERIFGVLYYGLNKDMRGYEWFEGRIGIIIEEIKENRLERKLYEINKIENKVRYLKSQLKNKLSIPIIGDQRLF